VFADPNTLGKWLLVLGIALAACGSFFLVLGKIGLPIGRMPGDFRVQTDGFTCFFPLGTSILLSVLLTLALNLLARWLSK
jgi:hypothetical protein